MKIHYIVHFIFRFAQSFFLHGLSHGKVSMEPVYSIYLNQPSDDLICPVARDGAGSRPSLTGVKYVSNQEI